MKKSDARRRTLLVIPLVAWAIVLAASVPVLAFDETGTGWDCPVCHNGATSIPTVTERTGPHGGYTTTSQKCQACHSVHAAPPGGRTLLPGATITATCFTCHDGTGGKGVYGTVPSPAAEHRVDTTNTIPGGDPVTGGEATATFSSLAPGARGL